MPAWNPHYPFKNTHMKKPVSTASFLTRALSMCAVLVAAFAVFHAPSVAFADNCGYSYYNGQSYPVACVGNTYSAPSYQTTSGVYYPSTPIYYGSTPVYYNNQPSYQYTNAYSYQNSYPYNTYQSYNQSLSQYQYQYQYPTTYNSYNYNYTYNTYSYPQNQNQYQNPNPYANGYQQGNNSQPHHFWWW